MKPPNYTFHIFYLGALRCDEFEVSGATDTSFDGEYEVSPLTVFGASEDEDVYEKKNGGGKFIFWKNGVWNLGSNKDTGVINYSGTMWFKMLLYDSRMNRLKTKSRFIFNLF